MTTYIYLTLWFYFLYSWIKNCIWTIQPELVCMLAAESWPILWNLMDCNPPGSSVHGLFQAMILEWVAISFSKGAFPTQGLNSGLLHCRRILYWLGHQGSPVFTFNDIAFSFICCSVAQSYRTLWDPMNCSKPGLPIHHQIPEYTQTHVHCVSDVIQSFHSQSAPSPPALIFTKHQGLFQWVSSSHQVAKVLELQFQHQSFQWIFRTDLL